MNAYELLLVLIVLTLLVIYMLGSVKSGMKRMDHYDEEYMTRVTGVSGYQPHKETDNDEPPSGGSVQQDD